MRDAPVMQLNHATKIYHRRGMDPVGALRDVSLEVAPGESLGLVGSNGSGKSTIMKLVCGISRPTRGSVRLFGVDPARYRRAVAARIGLVQGQRTQLWWDLPVRESLESIAMLYGFQRKVARSRVETIANALEASHLLGQTARTLSLGQRMRADLIAGLVHGPEFLLLDEPTVGLDADGRHRLLGLIESLRLVGGNQKPISLLYVSHDLADVQRICDRLVVMDSGEVAYNGDPEEFIASSGAHRTVRLWVDDDLQIDFPGWVLVERSSGRLTFELDSSVVESQRALGALLSDPAVKDVEVSHPTLESAIRAWRAR